MDFSALDLVKIESWLDNLAFLVLLITLLAYWGALALSGQPAGQPEQYSNQPATTNRSGELEAILQSADPAVDSSPRSSTSSRATVSISNQVSKKSLATLIGSAGMAIANLCLAALLIARWIEGGYFPLSNLYESLIFIAWGITALHLVAERMGQSQWIGVVTSPVAMGISAFATLTLPAGMQLSEPLVPALKSNWLMMHVSVMLLSYAALMVGSLIAIAFLIVTQGQAVELKGSSVGTGAFRNRTRVLGTPTTVASASVSHRADQSLQLSDSTGNTSVLAPPAPPVPQLSLSPQRLTLAERLDNISYRIIGLGFPLLTIGIIAGAVWANEAWGSYWSWDPKETWALITWLVFAAYLHARITKGWQGRKPAILAASGFVVVWICYLGVNLLGKGLHSYGWFF